MRYRKYSQVQDSSFEDDQNQNKVAALRLESRWRLELMWRESAIDRISQTLQSERRRFVFFFLCSEDLIRKYIYVRSDYQRTGADNGTEK